MKIFFHNYFKDRPNHFVICTVILGILVMSLENSYGLYCYDPSGRIIVLIDFIFISLFSFPNFLILAVSFALIGKLQNCAVKLSYFLIAISSGITYIRCTLFLKNIDMLVYPISIFLIDVLSIILQFMSMEYFELAEVERNQDSAGHNTAHSLFLN